MRNILADLGVRSIRLMVRPQAAGFGVRTRVRRNILAKLGVRSIRLMVRRQGKRQGCLCRLLSKGCLIVTGGAPATFSAFVQQCNIRLVVRGADRLLWQAAKQGLPSRGWGCA